jgi:hypothetical protein
MIRKTAAITAVSIAGVVLAGSAAVGANIGILDAADETGLGTLSAEAAISTPADSTVTTVTSDPSPATSAVTVAPSDAKVQTFAVDAAGTVDIETDDSGLHVKAVHANDGWTWEEASSGPDAVTLTFTSGGDTLEFVASLSPDGSIDARVDRPIVTSTSPRATTPAPAFDAVGGYEDDDDEYEGHDDDGDDDHEDDDHEEDEHEGRDDDD